MNKRLFHCLLAALSGLVLALALLWLGATAPAWAYQAVRYVAPPPTGSDAGDNDCQTATSPCATIQHAIDGAEPGNEIHVAGGIYARVGTVAVITKELMIIGGYALDFSVHDPDMHQTVLDAQWGGSVINTTNAGEVMLMHLTLTHGDGTGNCWGNGCGGGIYATGTNLRLGHCVITDNVGSRAEQGSGGGIYAHSNHVDIWESRIVSNTANTADNIGYGGGVYIYGATQANVLSNTIQGNKAGTGRSGADGGGLWLGYSTSAYVAGNRIENNWTNPNWAGYGGGVYVVQSDAHLARNTIISNATRAPNTGWVAPGGGISIGSNKPVTLSNNLIARNEASVYGGGVYVSIYFPPIASRAILVNNTIADNGESGVVAWHYAALTMTNNLVAGHATGLSTLNPFTGTTAADTNLFWNDDDPITGGNAILQNPLLTADYHLRSGSPAVDAGLTVPWLTTDLEGHPRPQGDGYDIGAFEGEVAWWAVYLPLVLR